MEQMRLDKFLTQTAGLTRSEAKQYLKKGRVCVDGAVVKKPETKIDADTAEVTVDGKNCHYEKYTYLMLHKPQGVVSATEDGRERTVLDLIREPARGLFPVGRLDKDTENWHMRCYRPESMWRSVILRFSTARWEKKSRRLLPKGWISAMKRKHCLPDYFLHRTREQSRTRRQKMRMRAAIVYAVLACISRSAKDAFIR